MGLSPTRGAIITDRDSVVCSENPLCVQCVCGQKIDMSDLQKFVNHIGLSWLHMQFKPLFFAES